MGLGWAMAYGRTATCRLTTRGTTTCSPLRRALGARSSSTQIPSRRSARGFASDTILVGDAKRPSNGGRWSQPRARTADAAVVSVCDVRQGASLGTDGSKARGRPHPVARGAPSCGRPVRPGVTASRMWFAGIGSSLRTRQKQPSSVPHGRRLVLVIRHRLGRHPQCPTTSLRKAFTGILIPSGIGKTALNPGRFTPWGDVLLGERARGAG
jgi:hypothetical protein